MLVDLARGFLRPDPAAQSAGPTTSEASAKDVVEDQEERSAPPGLAQRVAFFSERAEGVEQVEEAAREEDTVKQDAKVILGEVPRRRGNL